MKKILIVLLSLICIVTFVGCDGGNNQQVDDTNKNYVQIVSLVKNYSVDGTSGFDYSLEQKAGSVVVNSHSISIRLDNSNGTLGSRVENIKKLNEDITNAQYTETNATIYFKNNKVATATDSAYQWKNCSLEEFASIEINSFNFGSDFSGCQLVSRGKYSVFTMNVEDSKASAFLGVNGNVKNLVIEIKANADCTELVSFTLSYSQDLTTTSFKFVPYTGSVNISIPEVK